MHDVPCRGYGYVPLRFGGGGGGGGGGEDTWCPVPRLWIRSAEVGGGPSLGEWEHNSF